MCFLPCASRQGRPFWPLSLIHIYPFAPTVTDTFGVSAALSRALNLDERLSTARVKLEGARTLADSLPRPEEVSGGTDVEPRFDPAETAARLSAAEGELSRLRSGLAMAQGELNTLGDREALQTRREAIQEELDRRRAEDVYKRQCPHRRRANSPQGAGLCHRPGYDRPGRERAGHPAGAGRQPLSGRAAPPL